MQQRDAERARAKLEAQLAALTSSVSSQQQTEEQLVLARAKVSTLCLSRIYTPLFLLFVFCLVYVFFLASGGVQPQPVPDSTDGHAAGTGDNSCIMLSCGMRM